MRTSMFLHFKIHVSKIIYKVTFDKNAYLHNKQNINMVYYNFIEWFVGNMTIKVSKQLYINGNGHETAVY